MEFQSNRDNRLRTSNNNLNEGLVDDNPSLKPLKYSINFYSIPPLGKISLEDAEDMVEERLNRLFTFIYSVINKTIKTIFSNH